MSTHATISIQLPNNMVRSIYCHSDGYPKYLGKMLLENYQDEAKITKLINYGDASYIDKNLEPDETMPHSILSRQKDTCFFYGRDRGEKDVTHLFISLISLLRRFGKEHNYLYKDNQWWYCNFEKGKYSEWTELANIGGLKNDKDSD